MKVVPVEQAPPVKQPRGSAILALEHWKTLTEKLEKGLGVQEVVFVARLKSANAYHVRRVVRNYIAEQKKKSGKRGNFDYIVYSVKVGEGQREIWLRNRLD